MTTQVLAKRRLTVHDYKYFVISASCFLCFLLALMPVKILSLKKISLLALELKQRQRICSAESQRSVLNIFSILIGGQTPDKRNGKHQKDVWFVLGKKSIFSNILQSTKKINHLHCVFYCSLQMAELKVSVTCQEWRRMCQENRLLKCIIRLFPFKTFHKKTLSAFQH